MEDRIAESERIEHAWRTAQAAGLSRRQFLKVIAGLAGTAALGAGLGACSSGTPAPQATTAPGSAATKAPVAPAASGPTGTVRIAMPRAVSALDPRRYRTTEEQAVVHHVFDFLVAQDPKAQLTPCLAESWERVDLTTWRFKTRTGVKFHNGETFSAENVKFTIDQMANLNPAYYYISLWGPAWPPSAVVESPTSVLIRSAAPNPILPGLLTKVGMLPMKASLDATFPDNPIGTGPFKFVSWTKGTQVVMEANPDYWGGSPKISKLVLNAIADQGARLAGLEAGELELAFSMPVEREAKLPATCTTLSGPSLNIGALQFSFRNPKSPVANLKVRQALILGVDEKPILDNILTAKGAARMLNPGPMTTWGAVDCGGFPKRDVATAKRLLAEAGYANGLNLKLIYSPGEFTRDLEVCEAIQGQMAEIGVKITIAEMEQGAYVTTRGGPDWDIAPGGTGGWTGDAQFFIDKLSDSAGYNNTSVNAVLAEGNGTVDSNKRLERLQTAQKMVWADVPYLWGFEVVWLHGVTKKLTGVEMFPGSRLRMANAVLAA